MLRTTDTFKCVRVSPNVSLDVENEVAVVICA